MRIRPEDFSHFEEEFIEFCVGQGFQAGHHDVAREDPAYRQAIVQTGSWRRNEFDTYVVLPGNRLFFVDQKATTPGNGNTGNASIELRAIWAGLQSGPDITSIFVRPPDWAWITPRNALASRIGGCCDDCADLAVDGRFEDIPEKCPNQWFSGSGDPWVKVPLKSFLPWRTLIP
jgi:hypothetical protein